MARLPSRPTRRLRRLRPFCAGAARQWPALLLALAGPVLAHDTWFAPLPAGPQGEVLLALGTGAQFPRQETALDQALLQASGCRQPDGRTQPLQWVAYRDEATVLRVPVPDAPAGSSRAAHTKPAVQPLDCWLQARPLSITLDDAVVGLYLDEIRAAPAVRARWAALQARGVRWQERYTKHARIVALPPAPAAAASAAPATPGDDDTAGPGPALDLRPEMPATALRAGDSLRVQLLRDGLPLAGAAVVLRNDLNPLPLWHSSDAQGWLQLRLPLAARWLLSSVDLRPSDTQPDAWDSRFVSLTIETLPRR